MLRIGCLLLSNLFWAGYWTALFMVSLDEPPWYTLLCAAMSSYNLYCYWHKLPEGGVE